jgi:regulation of enolase protein 1 (concanavalin A-like superfamily)
MTMKAMISLVVLLASGAISNAALTANELMLLRVVLRQDMTADVQAAATSTDPLAKNRVAPLETALLGVPNVQELLATTADETADLLKRLNAGRALAYFGDTRCIEFLATIPQRQSRSLEKGPARSQAALCLLYLGYEFPSDLAFRKLTPLTYPELDAFVREPTRSLSPSSLYTGEELQATLALYLASPYSVIVRGPLSLVEVEQESLAVILRSIAKDGRTDALRIPFGDQYSEWQRFQAQVRTGDLVYGFTSEDAAWQAQKGSEGYALIRGGQVVTVILTTTKQGSTDLLAFDDFGGPLGFNWTILNSDPSHWSLSKVPGTLTITTQTGSFTRTRRDYRNIFLIPCPAAARQDFQVTTCLVGFEPVGLWNQAGLLIWNSEDYHVKLDYEYGEGPPLPWLPEQRMYTSAIEIGGVATHAWYEAPQNPQKVWLRIIKRGGFLELYASGDGQTFAPITALVPEWGPSDNRIYWGNTEVRYIGIYADNGTAYGAPNVDASFDFFEVKAIAGVNQ